LARVLHKNLQQAAFQRGKVVCSRRPCNLAMPYVEGHPIDAQPSGCRGSFLHALTPCFSESYYTTIDAGRERRFMWSQLKI
jgi:hypothetical protein